MQTVQEVNSMERHTRSLTAPTQQYRTDVWSTCTYFIKRRRLIGRNGEVCILESLSQSRQTTKYATVSVDLSIINTERGMLIYST